MSTPSRPVPPPSSMLRQHGGVAVPVAGRWQLDPAHTTVGFWVRHLGITKVRGRFARFDGYAVVADEPTASTLEVVIDAASITTGEPDRDEHLRSSDFLDVDQHPELLFRSDGVHHVGGTRWEIIGALTIRGTTRTVTLDTTFLGGATDPWGDDRIMLTADTTIDRELFGLRWNQVLEAGGVLVGRKVVIELEVQLVRAHG